MVRFFNQKEEVIDIELTPYGKQQFASGTFMPECYAFYDNNILYDSQYASFSETQNQTTNRIKNETPRIKPQVRFSSTPGSVFSLASSDASSDFLQKNSWNAPYYQVLGSSDPNSIYNPAWNINVLPQSEVEFRPGVSYTADNTIPQMSATINLNYQTFTVEDSEQVVYGLLESQKLLLDIRELNTIFKTNGNFDIQLFLSGAGPNGRITPLSFINNESQQAESLNNQINPESLIQTINGNNDQILENFPVLDETYVEFFLDIAVDREIDSIVIPSNSTLYTKDADRNPIDICDITQAQGTDVGNTGGE